MDSLGDIDPLAARVILHLPDSVQAAGFQSVNLHRLVNGRVHRYCYDHPGLLLSGKNLIQRVPITGPDLFRSGIIQHLLCDG